MELGNGIARSEANVSDYSQILKSGLSGKTAVLVITKRGEPEKSETCYSYPEYVRKFGEYTPYSNVTHLIKRCFENGGILEVSRAAHYTDPTDPTTIVGVKATKSLTGSNVDIDFEAKSFGDWGNNLKVGVKTHPTKPTTHGFIYEFLTDEKDSYKEYEVKFGDTDAKLKFNEDSRFANIININTFSTGFTQIQTTLTGGSEDYSNLDENDFVGDRNAMTGVYAFDEAKDLARMVLFQEFGDRKTTIEALRDYAWSRRITCAYPDTISNTGFDAVDDRQAYDIDAWWVRQIYGAVKAKNPFTGVVEYISVIGDWTGKNTWKDNRFDEWISEAGSKRGRLTNTLGVFYNLGTASRKDEANLVDLNGITMIIDHERFGPVIWGNGTLQKENTLLKHANIAEVVMLLLRTLPKISDEDLFDPNDPITWRSIWRKVSTYADYIQGKRGFYRYEYFGDQDVDRVEDAVVNTPDSIASAIYKYRLHIYPTPALKYVGIDVIVSKAGVEFEIVQ